VRIYAEASEIEVAEGVSPEFLRLDATDKDFEAVILDLKAMLHPDKKYSLVKHYCYHEENESCVVRILEDK